MGIQRESMRIPGSRRLAPDPDPSRGRGGRRRKLDVDKNDNYLPLSIMVSAKLDQRMGLAMALTGERVKTAFVVQHLSPVVDSILEQHGYGKDWPDEVR